MVKVQSDIVAVGDRMLDSLDKKTESAIFRAMQQTGLVGEARVKGIMEKEAYDTGRALRSVTHTVRREGDIMRLVVGTALEYVIAIEKGRKPGKWPNLDALTKWVGRKLRKEGVNTRVNVTFNQLKELARTGGKPATAQQKAYRTHLTVLYLVGRKIATRGIRGKMIFQRIQDGLLAYFRAQAQKELNLIR